MSGARAKVVLYNPKAVFFTMPLALLAIGSELDPARYEVIIVDGRLDDRIVVRKSIAPRAELRDVAPAHRRPRRKRPSTRSRSRPTAVQP